jgi:hypothetical protein
MECQDVQQLLSFVDRKVEELDETEREAIKQHLEKCPLCAEHVQAERRLDETLGPVMRDVAVPAGLKAKVLAGLSKQGRVAPWTWVAAAAAVLLIASSGSLFWFKRAHPEVKTSDVVALADQWNMDADAAEKALAKQGLKVTVPRFLNFNHLQHVDVTEFKGQRVGQMIFSRADGQPALARVLILPRSQFDVKELLTLDDPNIPGSIRVYVHIEDDYVYLVYYRGELNDLRAPPPAA